MVSLCFFAPFFSFSSLSKTDQGFAVLPYLGKAGRMGSGSLEDWLAWHLSRLRGLILLGVARGTMCACLSTLQPHEGNLR